MGFGRLKSFQHSFSARLYYIFSLLYTNVTPINETADVNLAFFFYNIQQLTVLLINKTYKRHLK